MKRTILVVGIQFMLCCASAQAAPAKLSAADEASAFKAAGFTLKRNRWSKCEDDAPSSVPGTIAVVRDVNGDGQPEAVITEGSSYCYGNTEVAYSLVSKQADGSWKLIVDGPGILRFLPTKGKDNWPDIEIGGPGFCFPVVRWNGKKYDYLKEQYEGKPCRRR